METHEPISTVYSAERAVVRVIGLSWYDPQTPPIAEEIVLVVYHEESLVCLQECIYAEDEEGFMAWRINGGCQDGNEISPSDIIGWADPADIIASFKSGISTS